MTGRILEQGTFKNSVLIPPDTAPVLSVEDEQSPAPEVVPAPAAEGMESSVPTESPAPEVIAEPIVQGVESPVPEAAPDSAAPMAE